MKSGFKLFWSDRALGDLRNILDYLAVAWTQNEVKAFAKKLDKRLEIIRINPRLFPLTKKRKNVRRSVLTRQTVIYYETSGNTINIIALFDSRQDPSKVRL